MADPAIPELPEHSAPADDLDTQSVPPHSPVTETQGAPEFVTNVVNSKSGTPSSPALKDLTPSELLAKLATSVPPEGSNVEHNPQKTSATGKTIICCFDGTGNKFGENSNVVRLLDALVKDQPDKQVIYYQPGIGTYSEHQYYTTTISQLFSRLDECLALFLDDHVKEGYKFIMQHYKPYDKICLFGFSRGAYIARVLMGMLYKVGLLPPDNIQQVDFAFSVYKMTGDKGRELSREFKKTFAANVTVEFVGVWDTVASVGITPTPVSRHPYTSVDYATKVFRHALALDERRVRFQPQTRNTATTDREQELDVDEPSFPDADKEHPYDYVPPNRAVADVKEVWFAGCHADIGGGSHHGRLQNSLSYIPFRWMIYEAIRAQCGILFDDEHLRSNYVYDARKRPDFVGKYKDGAQGRRERIQLQNGDTIPRKEEKRLGDVIAPLYDQLSSVKLWWALELFPFLTTYQTISGNWIKERRRNLGEGRRIPFHSDKKKVLVHLSVKSRMILDPSYKPKALNWELLNAGDMIQWVDEDKLTLWTWGYSDLKQVGDELKATNKDKKTDDRGRKDKADKEAEGRQGAERRNRDGGAEGDGQKDDPKDWERRERKARVGGDIDDAEYRANEDMDENGDEYSERSGDDESDDRVTERSEEEDEDDDDDDNEDSEGENEDEDSEEEDEDGEDENEDSEDENADSEDELTEESNFRDGDRYRDRRMDRR